MLAGKVGLVLGIANERSIAYQIAKITKENGAKLILTYPGQPFEKRLTQIAESFKGVQIYYCNVAETSSITTLFKEISNRYGRLDFFVHAVAFSDREELQGEYINTSLSNFSNAMHISCYSFTEIARHALPLMKENGGSMLTLSYYGAEKVVPHYNVMGPCKAALECSVRYLASDVGKHNIRVNSIAAGPIKTLASSAIQKFSHILQWNKCNSPLKRNTTTDDVAKSALYLLSDLASGVTGENLHVDCGYNVVGMRMEETPEDLLK